MVTAPEHPEFALVAGNSPESGDLPIGDVDTEHQHGPLIDLEQLTFRVGGQFMFDRITVEADKMGGQPCIRGLRIPVATIVTMMADGMTVDEILADLPDLEAEDVTEALRYAAETLRERELPLRRPA